MKKILILALTILYAAVLIGCSAGEAPEEEYSDEHYEDTVDTYTVLRNFDELADYMIEGNFIENKESFREIRQKNKTKNLDIYTLSNLPEGYELFEITHANYSSFISMDFIKSSMDTNEKAGINNPSFSLITFVWGFDVYGEECLADSIKMIGLEEMPGMPGYYYVGTVNEYDEEIYEIYWCKDGYSFQANIPRELIDKSDFDSQIMLADEYTDNIWDSEIDVKKIEYSLDDVSEIE